MVVLPAPFGPSSAVTVPAAADHEAPSTAVVVANDLRSSRTRTAPVTARHPRLAVMPRIDREAAPATMVAAAPAALALLLGRPRTAAVLGVLPVAVAAFFRDPERTPDHATVPVDDVLAPADGKVMHAGAGQEGVAPEGEWQQVSIFLSAFDVHINRTPYGGRVVEVAERPGKWLAAYKHESAHLNERSDITVERQVGDELRRVHFRQIVGLMARRVVTRVSEADELTTGQRVGLMKFGSRMDVFVPPECDLLVSTGDRVVAGETVIARWARPTQVTG